MIAQRRQNGLYWIGGCLMTAVAVWPLTGVVAEAATSHAPTYKMEQKLIELNGKTVAKPVGFASQNTMYMPIWYVMNALQSLGIKSTWKNNVWNMTVPSTFKVDTSKIQVGKGQISLEINGKLMHKVDGIAADDPTTGKPTMFIPIWYTQQLLQRVGISSPWDGTTWKLQVGSPDGHPVTPPPKLPSNEVATWQFLASVEKAFKVAPDKSGTSPYTDIASTDANFGVVQAAIQKKWLQPSSKTHSGAYDALTVQSADQILWNAFGITDASFQPGQSPFAWANLTGLNPRNVQSSDFVSPQEFTQMVSNLANNTRGFVKTGSGVYQIDYPIEDESAATFAGDSSSGQPFYTSTQDVQNAIVNAYQFYNQIQVQNQGGNWTLTLPSLSGTPWFSYTTTLGSVSYQLPGDANWQTTGTLDSRELTLSDTDHIRVKLIEGTPVTVSVNQLLPSLGGTVPLGDLQIEVDSNGLVVQRINVS